MTYTEGTTKVDPAVIARRQQNVSALLNSMIRPDDKIEDAMAWLDAIEQACMEKRRELANLTIT